ncbi:hypothetical protein GCM10023114_19930 [Mycolicibacterium sediminis]|uniref:Uncharacterized protein n=1 Tax=Mycolicibacterium sediminis TaxID=1286180 RepID=A0A7I7QR23_9MYCO|nr:hypothetical protein MSEDJ_25760 [Mycolicibacterium sediminis]
MARSALVRNADPVDPLGQSEPEVASDWRKYALIISYTLDFADLDHARTLAAGLGDPAESADHRLSPPRLPPGSGD